MNCVVKIGGSLLTRPDWPMAFRDWVKRQPLGDYLTIVGGGEAVEAMRTLDRIHGLQVEAMHWRCVRMLDATLEIAHELLPEARLAHNEETIRSATQGATTSSRIVLLRVAGFYQPGGVGDHVTLPPIGWETTTDTIAAYIARSLRIRRVVLLKSCQIDRSMTLVEAAEAGIVDAALPRIAEGLEVQLHQL